MGRTGRAIYLRFFLLFNILYHMKIKADEEHVDFAHLGLFVISNPKFKDNNLTCKSGRKHR